MNISPVSFINVNSLDHGYYEYKKRTVVPSYSSQIFSSQRCDSVSFTAAPNSAVLKKLLAYKIPDMYSEVILLDPEFLRKVMHSGLFSRAIRTICKTLQPYEDSLFPIEKQVFKIIKNAAKRTPKARLEEIVHRLVPEHNKKLLKLQQPIFDKLNELSKNLPDNLKAEYDELMSVTNQKLSKAPVVVPFSLKEFKYKLGRIQDRIQNSKNNRDIYLMRKLMNIVNNVPVYSEERRLRTDFPRRRYERRLKTMMLEVSEYIDTSELDKNKDLKELKRISKSQIYGNPVNINFNRKSFIYDLQKITNRLEDKKLAHRMVQTAISLPTSKENLSAFIVKAATRSSEQIGFDLLAGSIGTAEHLIPAIKGGDNNISNYGLASAYMNSERAHRAFKLQLKMYPEIYIYCQRQVDRLIELANSGVFKKIGLSKSYINTFVKNLYKLSPKEAPLIIDTSKLK